MANPKIAGVFCVTGANGFMAASLVKRLLELGYIVNATVRDPENQAKVGHLRNLPGAGERLRLFKADLSVEGSFDAAVYGCQGVFHVATPIDFHPKDPENDVIIPAVKGTLNVLESCYRAKTINRVVMTSSAAAYSLNASDEANQVIDESCWTDVDHLRKTQPPAWSYPVSKTLAEKAAIEFAKEKGMDLVTIAPVLMLGKSLTPAPPSSIMMGTSLLTGIPPAIQAMKGMQMDSGSVSVMHVEDAVSAHIHVYLNPSAEGRYLCCAVNSSVLKLAEYLGGRYPQYPVPKPSDPRLEGVPFEQKLNLSSAKLLASGFTFKYPTAGEIYDDTVEYLKSLGILK